MIRLTTEFAPSALFYRDEPTESGSANNNSLDFVRWMMGEAGKYLAAGKLREAERCARDAQESSRKARAHVDQAQALIHLSEVYREMGKLGPALRAARQAYDILRRQPGLAQRHNEAVAAYDLGLVHQLLGNEMDALNWYQTAHHLFELAREYWAAHRDGARVRVCVRLQRWIANLSDCVTQDRQYGGYHSTLIIPARLVGNADNFSSIARLRLGGFLLGQQLAIGDRNFQVYGLGDNGSARLGEPLLLEDEKEYSVYEVPEEVCKQGKARKGDYVLVERTEKGDLKAPYYVVEGGSGPDFGKFEREATTGEITFKSMTTGRVIGGVAGKSEFSRYIPRALLRPTS